MATKTTKKSSAQKTKIKKNTDSPKNKTKIAAKDKSDFLSKGDDLIKLRIRVRAYENKILDASVKQIIDTASRYDADIIGQIPLPTEKKKYTVNRSPFIFKDSREQFEIRVHKRVIDISNPSAKIIDALTNL